MYVFINVVSKVIKSEVFIRTVVVSLEQVKKGPFDKTKIFSPCIFTLTFKPVPYPSTHAISSPSTKDPHCYCMSMRGMCVQ